MTTENPHDNKEIVASTVTDVEANKYRHADFPSAQPGWQGQKKKTTSTLK